MSNQARERNSNVDNLTAVRTPKRIGKKLIATLLTVAMLIGVNTGVFATGVASASEHVEEIVAEYGYDINEYGEVTPRINTQTSVTIKERMVYKGAVMDTPLFDETVTVTIDALSSNIRNVQVQLRCNVFTTFWNLDSSTLYNGSSCSFDVKAGTRYEVRVQVLSGTVSETNPGTVTITVSDK